MLEVHVEWRALHVPSLPTTSAHPRTRKACLCSALGQARYRAFGLAATVNVASQLLRGAESQVQERQADSTDMEGYDAGAIAESPGRLSTSRVGAWGAGTAQPLQRHELPKLGRI